MTSPCLEQLIDLQAIRKLLASYYNLTGISCTLFDTDQNLLIAEGWQDICIHFHRQHPVSAKRCERSNVNMLSAKAVTPDGLGICQESRCENGMIYLSLPVMVDTMHLGTLVAGKFFYEDEPLDKAFFTAQALELGLDQASYFAALAQVPVFQRSYVCRSMQLLNNMVSMLAATGLANLHLEDRTLKLQEELQARVEAENTLHIQAVLLEEEIAERQKAQEEQQLANQQLAAANRALKMLSSSNRSLLHSTTEEEQLNQVCRIAVEVGGYVTAWVGFALHDDNKSIIPMAWCGIDEEQLNRFRMSWSDEERGASAMGSAIRTGTVRIYQNVLNNSDLAPWHSTARMLYHQSAIALPLRVQGEVIGALAIYASEPYAFQQDEVELLRELALDLAFGIQTIRDRQTHAKAQAHIKQLAYYDRLTGLPNQYKFMKQLDRSITAAAAEKQPFSLMLLDLNYLHEINETHGHALGDEVLVKISRQLQDICLPECFLARFGGDFAIICPDCDQNTAVERAKNIIATITVPFFLSGQQLHIGGSIGLVLYPEDGDRASELMSKVDLAASRAKASGGGYCFYRPEMGQQLARTLRVARRLEFSIADNRLELFYQPKFDLMSGRLVGTEALLRWKDQQIGWVSPAEFIPVAEARGLMPELGNWVLQTACCQIRQWQQQGNPHPGRIAINVSVCQLEATDFIETVLNAVESAGISPDSIELELTESILMSDPEQAVTILNRLRSKGFSLAIDDFGTGYSSLAYLKRLPINTLKIDQAFVRDMLHDSGNRAIVAAIIAMARQLGLATVAEGVEELEQSLELLELGCSQAQGFYFGRPVSADEYKQKWLESR
jgi:diguanylate cyclase